MKDIENGPKRRPITMVPIVTAREQMESDRDGSIGSEM